MPFLRDKEDVFLLPKNEREEEEVKEEEEEIISRAAKLGYSHSLLYVYTSYSFAREEQVNEEKERKKRKKKGDICINSTFLLLPLPTTKNPHARMERLLR